MSETLRYSQEQYEKRFDPETYLGLFYKTLEGSDKEEGLLTFYLFHNHEFWTTKFQPCTSEETRCLEFGGGPVLSNLMSGAPKLDYIVFSDFVEANRKSVLNWIADKPGTHDWLPILEYVVNDLEGNKEPGAVQKREQELKHKLKSVVACDVSKTPIVDLQESDVGKPFDVVLTSLCLEACVQSQEEYKATVKRLGEFVGPRGYLLMSGVLEQTFYFVGDEKFYTFFLTKSMVDEAMKEAGFGDVVINTAKQEMTGIVSDCQGKFFCYGRKAE